MTSMTAPQQEHAHTKQFARRRIPKGKYPTSRSYLLLCNIQKLTYLVV